MSNKANKIIIGGVSYNIEDTETKNKVEELNSVVEEKADREDYCPKLTSGFANNLSGRGEAIETQITFRPTGGTKSIEDGVAHIECVKGNTIVWNQLAQPRESTTTNGLTIESVGDGSYKLYTAVDTPTTADVFFPVTDALISGHKVVFYGGTAACTLKASSGVQDTGAGAIIASAVVDEVVGVFVAAGTTINTAVTIFPQVVDITKIVNSGAKATISSVAEFRELFPKADNPYNAGEMLSMSADAIKAIGFNQFDKTKAQYGVINGSTVSYYYNNHGNKFYVSDYIRVVPSEKYYFKNIVGRYYWTAVQALDADKQYIGWYMPPQANSNIMKDSFIADFSNRPQVCYIRICLPAECLDSCCVSLVHTGYRNGDYEPYEETNRQLPIKEYFPDGMRSTRNYDGTMMCDELTNTQAIQRIGVIADISKLNWSLVNNTFVSSKISNAPNNTNYLLSTLNYSCNYYKDKCYTITDSGRLYIKDSACATVSDLKTVIAGVSLNYPLATPIVTDLPEPINLDYKVSDFGTEEALFDGNSAPLKADIVYGFNAVDTIRSNRLNIEDLLARVAALENKL